jgi:hypothetical protein
MGEIDYNKILGEFLEIPSVKEYIEETKLNFPRLSKRELVIDAIDYFFTYEFETVLQIKEVFDAVAGHVRDEVERITMDYKHLTGYMDTAIEDLVAEKLKEIKDELIKVADDLR